MTRKLQFDSCFDRRKIMEISPLLPDTYAALNDMARWRKGRWPTRVRCMTDSRIIEGRRRGAGHGSTYIDGNSIWINPHMSAEGYWLVLIHENLHHAFPDATEHELNNVLVPRVYNRVIGHSMPREWARNHGLGPPGPGIGDRGYVY